MAAAVTVGGHMSASVANILLTGVILGLLLLPASADDPPTLNMGPTCDAAAAGAIGLKIQCVTDAVACWPNDLTPERRFIGL